MKRRRDVQYQSTIVDQWNAVWKVGVEVSYREDDGRITESATRSEAWLLGEHTAVVLIEGRSGAVALDRITQRSVAIGEPIMVPTSG